MPAGRSFKHQLSLQDKLTAWSDEVCKQAAQLPRGSEREVLLAKICMRGSDRRSQKALS